MQETAAMASKPPTATDEYIETIGNRKSTFFLAERTSADCFGAARPFRSPVTPSRCSFQSTVARCKALEMFTDPRAHSCIFFTSSRTTKWSCDRDEVEIMRVLMRRDSRNDGELTPVGNLESESEEFPSQK